MSGLVEKLEAAEVGSRELDRELMALTYRWEKRHIGATCWDDCQGTCCPAAKHLDWVWVDPNDDQWKTNAVDGYEFTTSLDAALALAERVLPGDPDFQPTGPSVGWKINLYRGMVPAPLGGWIATVRRHASDGFDGSASTPALALCIAICRALNLNETRHD